MGSFSLAALARTAPQLRPGDRALCVASLLLCLLILPLLADAGALLVHDHRAQCCRDRCCCQPRRPAASPCLYSACRCGRPADDPAAPVSHDPAVLAPAATLGPPHSTTAPAADPTSHPADALRRIDLPPPRH